MATVLLLGLDDLSAATIAKLTVQAGHLYTREPFRTTWETRPAVDVVFLSGDGANYRESIEKIRQFSSPPPIIVVSRLGGARGWIEALEAGATDFVAEPYSLQQIAGVIAAAIPRAKAFAA
jgi:DNA-binding response OmpR family regulator